MMCALWGLLNLLCGVLGLLWGVLWLLSGVLGLLWGVLGLLWGVLGCCEGGAEPAVGRVMVAGWLTQVRMTTDPQGSVARGLPPPVLTAVSPSEWKSCFTSMIVARMSPAQLCH